jgi:hypothetical protein
MTNQNQELLFIFVGITYAGAMLLTLAVLAAIRRLKAPKPPKVIPVYFAALEALRLQHRRPPPKTAKQHIKLDDRHSHSFSGGGEHDAEN